MTKKNAVKAVFFAYTKEEALWVIHYLKDQLQDRDQIKVIGVTLSAQLEFLQHLGRNFDQNQLFKKTENFNDHVTVIQQQSVNLYELLVKKLRPFLVYEVNLIHVLKILIQSELIDAVFAYDIYKRIERFWKPNLYYFPHDLSTGTSGWQSAHFSAAAIIKDFLGEQRKICTFVAMKPYPYLNFKNLPLPKVGLKNWKSAVELFVYKLKDLFQTPQLSPTDALLFSGGYNLYYYHNLFRLLNLNPSIKVTTLTGFQTIDHELLLRKNSIPFVSLESFADSVIERETAQFQSKFHEYLKKEVTEKQVINVILPQRLPYEYRQALFYKLRLTLSKYSKRLIRQTLLARKAITIYSPNLVVTTHDPGPSALPFVLRAKADKIPTLVLLHGYHGMSYGADHESDYIASWGPLLKKGFTRVLKKKNNSVFTVGFPFFDEYFTKRNNRTSQLNQLTIAEKPVIRLGLLMTLYQIDQLASPHFLFELFSELGKANIFIKLEIRTHAGQTFEGIEELAQHFNVAYVYNEPISLDQFIRQNDVIISWDTTAILWALLYHKPLMYTTPWWCQGLIPAPEYKAAWLIRSAKELVEKLEELQNQSLKVRDLLRGQQKMLQEVLGVTDGTSSEKLLELMKNLVKGKVGS